jgi:thiol-disulfide isomerase/thioredoxin
MSRLVPALLAGALLLSTGTARAADFPTGSWKLTIPGTNLRVLFTIEKDSNGKWTGKFLGSNIDEAQTGKITLGKVTVSSDSLQLSFTSSRLTLNFDGRLPPDPKTGQILGSIAEGTGQLILAHLEPSKLTTFDRYALDRETLEQSTDSQALADAAYNVFKEAGAKKEKIENLRGWADKTYKASEGYGPRWQRFVTLRLAQSLLNQKDSYALAVEYARKAERSLDESDSPDVQIDVLQTVEQVMAKAGKADDAKQIQARLTKLEEQDLAEYLKRVPFKPTAFAGRKGKSDRTVLVELFTGAECPPCVAADVAFDALEKTYKPSEVVLLEYHVHVPRPDPLTNPDTMARLEYYKQIEGTPTAVFDGKASPGGGGRLADSRESYTLFREAVETMLEKNAGAKIELAATRQGSDINIKANVSDLAKTGDKIRLRFVLVEERIRYAGGNGQRYHHCVVRSFPGGVKGIALANKSSEQTAKVNLDELRTKLNEYLDAFAKNEGEFPRPDRPLSLKGLRVVAFVQDDATNEVLQSAQVELKE